MQQLGAELVGSSGDPCVGMYGDVPPLTGADAATAGPDSTTAASTAAADAAAARRARRPAEIARPFLILLTTAVVVLTFAVRQHRKVAR